MNRYSKYSNYIPMRDDDMSSLPPPTVRAFPPPSVRVVTPLPPPTVRALPPPTVSVAPPLDYMLRPNADVVRALFASGQVLKTEQTDAGTSRWILTLRSGQKCLIPWNPVMFAVPVLK